MYRSSKLILILILFFISLGIEKPSMAQGPGELKWGFCVYRTGIYNAWDTGGNIYRRFRYKIDVERMSRLLNMKPEDIIQGVHMAAAIWNEQACGGYFVYMGESNSYPDCGGREGWQEFEVFITAEEDGGTAAGGTVGICSNKTWTWADKVIIYAKNDKNPNGINWSIVQGGTPSPHDFVANLVHEFGHVLGLGHSLAPIKRSIMRVNGTNNMLLFRRNLFEYDLYCLHAGYLRQFQKGPRPHLRLLRAYVRDQRNDGSFDPPRLAYGAFATQIGLGPSNNWFGGTWPMTSSMAMSVESPFSPDDRPDEQHFRWKPTYYSNTCKFGVTQRFVEYEDLKKFPSKCYDSTIHGSGPVVGYFKELPTIDRVFYSDWKQTDTNFPDHPAHKVLFSTDLCRDPFQKELYYCNTMGKEGECEKAGADKSNVMSAWPVRVVWDEHSQKTVFLWVHDAGRGSIGADNQIRMSFGPAKEVDGNYSEDTINKPFMLNHPVTKLPLRLIATPGLACKQEAVFGGKYDILLIYSDFFDPLSVYAMGLRYDITSNKLAMSNPIKIKVKNLTIRTATCISTWYHKPTKRFYMAYRDSELKMVVIIHDNGSGGQHWFFSEKLKDTRDNYQVPTGISVATKPNGGNIIGYVRIGYYGDSELQIPLLKQGKTPHK